MRRRILIGPSHLPCTKPPFGSLVAIDLESGRKLWDVPLGDLAALGGAGATQAGASREEVGSPNLGGPLITAGGVVFVGATIDHAIRAFDIETGKLLWQGALPGGARATPMTYRAVNGRQFVVICVGGGDEFGNGDYVIAFALAD